MVSIEGGGAFTMGSDEHYPEEGPAHRAQVGGFWIDRTRHQRRVRPVRLCDRLCHLPERPADPALYPDAVAALLVPGSSVFQQPDGPVSLRDQSCRGGTYRPGANWRHPTGPGSSTSPARPTIRSFRSRSRMSEAYAAWCTHSHCRPKPSGNSLLAAGSRAKPIRGAMSHPGRDQFFANTWQGQLSAREPRPTASSARRRSSSFPPNGYGLYDMVGNVWEWTSDWYGTHVASPAPCCGDPAAETGQPQRSQPRKVLKGGSFLCAPNYCKRYRPAARIAHDIDTATCHIGFRLIRRL